MANFSFNFAGYGAVNAVTLNVTGDSTLTGAVAVGGALTATLPTFKGMTVNSSAGLPYAATFDTGMAEESYIAPAQITANQTNWDIGGATDARRFNRAQVTSDAARAINSIEAPGNRMVLWIQNCNTNIAFTITLTHEHAGSTAANRFICPAYVDKVIPAGGAAFCWYDTAATRWRVAA